MDCPGATIGCKESFKRCNLTTHTISCTFATLEPLFRRQDEKLKVIEEENNILKRKVDSFGDGLIHTNVSLSTHNDSIRSDLRFSPLPPSAIEELSRLPDAQPATVTTPPTDTPDNAPFDSAIDHLLSSYESLRHDINRISASLNELDARQSMLIMNENLRVKEDFSHINAIIGSMRVQLHWLMSTRLQGQQFRAGSSNGGMTGPSNSPRSGAGQSAGSGSGGMNILGSSSQPLRSLSGKWPSRLRDVITKSNQSYFLSK